MLEHVVQVRRVGPRGRCREWFNGTRSQPCLHHERVSRGLHQATQPWFRKEGKRRAIKASSSAIDSHSCGASFCHQRLERLIR